MVLKQTITLYRPQQNGVLECANRSIIEIAKNMLHFQKFNKSFWTKAVTNVVYIGNRCPIRAQPSIVHREGDILNKALAFRGFNQAFRHSKFNFGG